jgi:hypothetical protein
VSKREELIASIVDSIKSSPHSRSDIESIVGWQADVLATLLTRQPSFGRQAENKQYGVEVEKLARQLQRKIKTMPEGSWRLISTVSSYAYFDRPLPSNQASTDFDMVHRFENALESVLKALEVGSRVTKESKAGDYHRLDRTKHFCACTGFEILIGLGADEPTNGDPYRHITNLMYEIVAPDEAQEWRKRFKKDPDLRSQCEKVISEWRSDAGGFEQHRQFLKHSFAGMIAQKSASSM